MRRLLVILFLFWPAVSHAAVRISFYSRDFGVYYPHAFIVLKGNLDTTGEAVDANFGWTSTATSILIAGGRHVPGVVTSESPKYIGGSIEDFAFTLTDEEYHTVMARVQYWRDLPQPSYSLSDANCVYFIADIARTLGLSADPKPGLMLKPKSFLQSVRDANRSAITARAQARPALASPAPAGPPAPAAVPVEVPPPPSLALY